MPDFNSIIPAQVEPIKCGLEAENEARLIAADVLYNEQKNSGELERRRVAFAHRLDDPFRRGW